MRALPNNYTPDSSYTWFPLMTPDAMQKILKNLGDDDKYTVARPKPTTDAVELDDYRDVAQVLGNPESFTPLCASRAAKVIKGEG